MTTENKIQVDLKNLTSSEREQFLSLLQKANKTVPTSNRYFPEEND